MQRLYDHKSKGSLAFALRQKRMDYFRSLLDNLAKPLTLLDAGGTEEFWIRAGYAGNPDYKITLLNLEPAVVHYANFTSHKQDVRDLSRFKDKSFDVVFSNSVIEHVGDFADQQRMAAELTRVARNLFVQTPNFYFPIEPHFVFPFFQFLPLSCRTLLIQHFDMGWRKKVLDWEAARREASSVRLLTLTELRTLFPGTFIRAERLWGLAKSFMVVKGFGR